MRLRVLVLTILALVLSSTFIFTSPAFAHDGEVVSADCTTASATFQSFEQGDHPISFEVSVNGAGFENVAAVESPPSFIGAGTATADITSVTAALHGTPGDVSVYAVWPGGQTAVSSYTLTCGEPPPTTTTPPTTTIPPAITTIPPAITVREVTTAPPVPATPVPVHPETAG